MITFSEFLSSHGLSYKEENFHNLSWIKSFWEKIRSEKIDKDDFNFGGYEFPDFHGQNFHANNSGSDRVVFENANFAGAVFRGEVDFSMITFKGVTNFDYANFLKKSSFSNIWFESPTYFKNCTFNNQLLITWCEFYEECDFTNSTFSKDHLTLFRPIQNFKMFHEHTRFSGIIFPPAFKFLYCDLSKVSFSGSFLKELNFDSCKFEDIWGRLLLFDEEKTFERRGTAIEARHFIFLENMYRDLRFNLEEKKNYYMAGKFYISEMEMRRQRLLFEAFDLQIPSIIYYKSAFNYKGNLFNKAFAKFKMPVWKQWAKTFLERILLCLYKLISNYGQSPGRVLVAFIFSFIIAVLALSAYGYDTSKIYLIILKALTFQQDSSNRREFVMWIITILRIVSAILLPLFILSLKRVFRR